MQSRASRVARGWITGSFATAVAALSHGLADGVAPSALSLGVGVVFAGVLGTLVLGRRPSLPRLTILVAGAQVAFHLVFSWLTPGTALGGDHHGVPALLAPAVAHHGTAPAMWGAHALALVATLVFLRRAEVALWSLLSEAVLAVVEVARRLPAIGALPLLAPASVADAPRHPVLLLLRFVVSHRGPPRAACAH